MDGVVSCSRRGADRVILPKYACTRLPDGCRLQTIATVSHIARIRLLAADQAVSQPQPLVPFLLIMFGLQILEYRRIILFYLERRRCARVYYRGQPVLPARIGFLLPLNKQTYKAFTPASLAALAVTITSFALANFVHHGGSGALMCTIAADIATLNYIGDARRSAIHPFLEHLKVY